MSNFIFLEKIRKILSFINLSSAEFAKRVLKIHITNIDKESKLFDKLLISMSLLQN